jgi:hypothetical protein
MGKDINGKELGKGITQRRDGRYSFRGTINGIRREFTAHTLTEVIEKKNEFNDKKKRISMMDDSRYIYFIYNGKHCKIGYATDLNNRMSELQTASSKKLQLLYSFKTFDYSNIENQLHKIFANRHVSGEWYDILDIINGDNKL